MNSHNTKTDTVVRKDNARIQTNREEVRVLKTTLAESRDFAMAEDYEIGGDPYNSTGRHVIIKPIDD